MEKKDKKPSALVFIFITLLIDITGLGIIVPVLPTLIQELTGGDISQASQYGGMLLFVFAIMQFLFSPIIGGLSDQFGRRPVILISLLGFGLDYLFLGFAPNIMWLFVGRMVAGITGASFTAAGAYIADVSEPEKRAQNFGIIGAAFGLGFIIGPVMGGLLGSFGPRVPFFASAILALLNCIYGYFVLPESLPKDKRRKFSIRRTNPITSFLQLKRYPVVLKLAFPYLLFYVAGHATQSVWPYYVMEKFAWGEQMVGYSLGVVGLLYALSAGGLNRIVTPKFGVKKVLYGGMILYAVGLLCFGVASASWMMFVFMVPFALGGLAGPALQSIISNQVPLEEQGELQGVLNSLVSVTSIIGPVLMTGLFSYFTATNTPLYLPGAPLMVGAILTIMSIAFAMRPLSSIKAEG